MEKAQVEATEVIELRKRVSELEATDVVKLDEVASLNAQNAELSRRVIGLELVCDGLKNQVAKLEVDCEHLRGEVAGEAKLKANFMSVDDWTWSPSRLDEEGLEAVIEHGRAGRSLAAVEAYDSRVEAKYVAVVQDWDNVTVPVYYERGGSKDPGSISHEILLSDSLAASRARCEKHKKARLEIGGPSVVTPSLSSQEESLATADHQVSSAANVDGTVPSSKPHDDLFDAIVLDRPVDS
ncbi:hypothetical protein Tco_0999437 [Tanacetum coccineum]